MGSTYVEVAGELGADDTVGAVGAHDLAPDNTELGAGNGGLGLVDVGDLLSEVVLASLGVVDAVDLQEGGVVVGVAATSAQKEDQNTEAEISLER